MQIPSLVSSDRLRLLNWITSRRSARIILPFVLILLCGSTLPAQQASDETAIDKHTVQLLMERIDQLEARVRQLEADKQQAGDQSAATAPGFPVASSVEPLKSTLSAQPSSEGMKQPLAQVGIPASPAQSERSRQEGDMSERMDVSKTLLRIRGFGDVNLHGDTHKGDTTSFSLGQLDLFVTSDISEKFKFLSEIVFEGGPDTIYGVTLGKANLFTTDIERYFMQYSPNDYVTISAGRVHTAIGFYNTAYHHSTWFQTTTDRPFLFNFEDRGGILPVHTVGVSVSGLIPSGRLGLHYIAEVANGRESRAPLLEEPVANVVDEENHKAINLALFARPEAFRGLQVGFSVYRDGLEPPSSRGVEETIMAVHAVITRPTFEWLNEGVVIRHSLIGQSKAYNTPGFYTQVSRQYGLFRPYFRYQYVNVAKTEPIFPDVGLRHGPSAGIRYDVDEFVALKFQYDYTFLRQQPGINSLSLQLGFTF
jgi:hypothetical protein